MSISSSISRFTAYFRRHGFRSTLRRLGLAARRTLFSNRMVLFYSDISEHSAPTPDLPASLQVERKKNEAELSPQDLEKMTSFWNPKLAHRNINERFKNGASLWLIKLEDQLAGYSWTIRGRSIASYYFPIAQDDVQLFDFHVFPQFRGRAILWFLVSHILHSLRDEGAARVFGDVAEWNQASLSFYRTTSFRPIGLARKFTVLGRTFVWWAGNETEVRDQKVGTASIAVRTGKPPASPLCER
jgi:ribosomal protein S18 acetylase RimI-like enzyme